MGVMRPELIMKSIIPVVMAGVLGIYGLIIAVIISTGSEKSLQSSLPDSGPARPEMRNGRSIKPWNDFYVVYSTVEFLDNQSSQSSGLCQMSARRVLLFDSESLLCNMLWSGEQGTASIQEELKSIRLRSNASVRKVLLTDCSMSHCSVMQSHRRQPSLTTSSKDMLTWLLDLLVAWLGLPQEWPSEL